MRAPAVLKKMMKFATKLLESSAGKGAVTKGYGGGEPVDSAADGDGMVVDLGGAALATGDSTLATGSLDNNLVHNGHSTLAWGQASFAATATGYGGAAPPAALAGTYVDVAGADLVLVMHADFQIGGRGFQAAKSQLYYVAIDIDGWSPPGGQITLAADAFYKHGPGLGGAFNGALKGAGRLELPPYDANVAHVSADANAIGPDTFAGTGTQALTVMDQFSLVQGNAVTAIG